MSILVFDKFLGHNVGGAQRSLHALLAALKNQEITFVGCAVKNAFAADRLKIGALPIERLNIIACPRFPYLEYWLNRGRLKNYFVNRTESLLITQGLWGAAAARFFPGKTILFIRDEYQLNRIPFYQNGFKKFFKLFYLAAQLPGILLLFADTRRAIAKSSVVANSNFIAREVKRLFGTTASVIYPPLEKFALSINPPSEGGFLTVMGSEYIKGRPIVERLARLLPNEKFMIVGREFVKRGQKKNIVYEPWTNQPAELYARTRIILVPSICSEGFCRVALEAMALGIPVIASNRGGLPEVVDSVCLVKNIWDINAWKEKIQMVENEYQNHSERARAQSKRFNSHEQVNKFTRLLASLGVA